MSYRERLKQAMAESEFNTPTKLAARIGAKSQGVSQVINGPTEALHALYHARACVALGVASIWLADGVLPMRAPDTVSLYKDSKSEVHAVRNKEVAEELLLEVAEHLAMLPPHKQKLMTKRFSVMIREALDEPKKQAPEFTVTRDELEDVTWQFSSTMPQFVTRKK